MLSSSLRHLLLCLMPAILLRVFSSLQAISFIYKHLYWTQILRSVCKSNFLLPHPLSLSFERKAIETKEESLSIFCCDLTRFPKFCKLRNLKKQELVLNYYVFCLLLCTSPLHAAPSLNKFTIRVNILTSKLQLQIIGCCLFLGEFYFTTHPKVLLILQYYPKILMCTIHTPF